MMAMRIKAILLAAVVMTAAACGNQTREMKNGQDMETVPGDDLLAGLDRINEAMNNDPDNPDLYQERAQLYLDHEAFNEAFKDITTALELDSTYAGYHVTLADVYLGMGKLQKTVESLETAIMFDKGNTDAYLRLAEMSIVIRDYKKALTYVDLALQVDDLLAKAYLLRGVVLMENGDTLRSIRNFQRAIDVDQDYLEAYVQLGMLYALKKNDLAIDYFNNALNIDPKNTDVNYYLAMYYQESGSYEKAIQTYDIILGQQPDFYIALYNIGYINLVFLNDHSAAVEYFTRTLDINPEYTEAWYNRGFAKELMLDAEGARKDYEKTLELHPNYEKAVDGMNRVTDYLIRQN